MPCVFTDKKEPRPLADPEKLRGFHKDSISVLPLGLWGCMGNYAIFLWLPGFAELQTVVMILRELKG